MTTTEIRDHHMSGILGFSQCLKQYPDPAKDDLRREIVMACKPGDMVMHHCAMVHMASKNNSASRQRRALGFIYYHEDCEVDQVLYEKRQARIRAENKKKGLLYGRELSDSGM
jgi:ectoine hydroxylase-related dioxygenase (phytanoyl-CoA dioxygenase family)